MVQNATNNIARLDLLTPEQKQTFETLFPDIKNFNEEQKRDFLYKLTRYASNTITKFKNKSNNQAEQVSQKAIDDAKKEEELANDKQKYYQQSQETIAQLKQQLTKMEGENKQLQEETEILATNERLPWEVYKYITIYNRQARKLEKLEKSTDPTEGMRYIYYTTYPVGVRHLARALNKAKVPFFREDPKKVARRFREYFAKLEQSATTPRQKLVVKKLIERYTKVYERYAAYYNSKYGISSTL